MSFTQKNENRNAAKAALKEKHGEREGAKLYRDYRRARRTELVGGAFGNLDSHDFNAYVIGTSGVQRVETGDAER